MSVKNSNDAIGNRTRDLPACSAVPQPTHRILTNVFRIRDLKFAIFFTAFVFFTPPVQSHQTCYNVQPLHTANVNICTSYINVKGAGITQSVQRLATSWTVRRSNPGEGEIFRTHPDRPSGPPNLLYSGYRVFPESGQRVPLTTHPHLAARLKKE